jgi:alkylation response protein AidB-like acyl-CoA dehydrogenase
MSQTYGATLEEREALIEAARSIAPQIREASDEIEAARQLPGHVVDLLKSIGAFRLIQPRWLGGHDADPVTQILFISELARADASVAWCVMIGCDGGFVTRDLPQELAREMYSDIDVATCGAAFPPGDAKRVPGGYLASGRWPYASGVTHAAWVQFGCRVVSDSNTGDEPGFVRFVVPRDEVTVLDTWRTTGMCGTGSHDIEVNDLFVPDERSLAPRPSSRSVLGDPLCHPAWLLPKHLGVPLGLTAAAYDEVLDMARERVAVRGRLSDDALTQSTLGETAARIAGCRAYALSAADTAWQEVCETGEMSDETRAQLRLAITFVHRESVRIVEQLYSIAGSSALYTEHSTLDRRLRDMHAMNQHVVLGASNYAAAGRLLLGLEPGAPFW